ncbi:hypothetical protein FNF29_02900 [Cafeteria roenbergensis]|uniref:Uncharacterized protein n=1 Tax=Cafeteria roenbergensis TaxID=33653 RepID=A0A5A8CLI3_CAFRO|nr:hypothetical protein FNF29_02900 [Cafeteria roenbergensis]|eukprot:KAA0153912.1 hypothetical protein FNF29_02900 [Cafeteria roenbergensis]
MAATIGALVPDLTVQLLGAAKSGLHELLEEVAPFTVILLYSGPSTDCMVLELTEAAKLRNKRGASSARVSDAEAAHRLIDGVCDPDAVLGFTVLFRESAAPPVSSPALAAAQAAGIPIVVDDVLFDLLRGPPAGAHAFSLVDSARKMVRTAATLPDCVAFGLDDIRRSTAGLCVQSAFPMLTVPANWKPPSGVPPPSKASADRSWPGLASLAAWWKRKPRVEATYLAPVAQERSSGGSSAESGVAMEVAGSERSPAESSRASAAPGGECACSVPVTASTPYLARWVPEDTAQRWFPGALPACMPSHKVYMRPVDVPWHNRARLVELSTEMQTTISRLLAAGSRAGRTRKSRVLESLGIGRAGGISSGEDTGADGEGEAGAASQASSLASPWASKDGGAAAGPAAAAAALAPTVEAASERASEGYC